MMKRLFLIGGGLCVVAGLAIAQMMPPADMGRDGSEAFPGQRASEAFERALDETDKELQALEKRFEQALKEDEEFLKLDLGPQVDVSGVERVPSAAQNQPYRTCEYTPQMQANRKSLGAPGNRAYRDINSFLWVTNVIATKDCTCKGKIIPHEAIARFETELKKKYNVEVLEPKHTRDLYEQYERDRKIVAAMCGEL